MYVDLTRYCRCRVLILFCADANERHGSSGAARLEHAGDCTNVAISLAHTGVAEQSPHSQPADEGIKPGACSDNECTTSDQCFFMDGETQNRSDAQCQCLSGRTFSDPIARTELTWISFREKETTESLEKNWETACDSEFGGGSSVSLTKSDEGTGLTYAHKVDLDSDLCRYFNTVLFEGSLCVGMTDVSKEREEESKRSAIRCTSLPPLLSFSSSVHHVCLTSQLISISPLHEQEGVPPEDRPGCAAGVCRVRPLLKRHLDRR
eukprot:3599788-Rhodomonas_salina.2